MDSHVYPKGETHGSAVDSGRRLTLGYINGLHYTATRTIDAEAGAIEEKADATEEKDDDAAELAGPRCYTAIC